MRFSEKEAQCDAESPQGQIYKILERITDAFVALDKNWCYTYVNEKAAKIFNRRQEYLIGKHIWTEFPKGVGQPFYHAYRKAAKTQTFVSLLNYYEPWDRWFENRIYPSQDGLSIFFRDVTEEKKIEAQKKVLEIQLRQSQKMETVGTLASGIAHDFDNLLAVISNQAEYIKSVLPKRDETVRSMAIIDQAIAQAAGVTKSLLTFSSQLPSEKTWNDLSLIINESLHLLGCLLPASIKIVKDLPADCGVWVLGNRSQLQQVLMNIVVNARDAMPKGGEIRVKLTVEHQNQDQAGKAILTLEDTGMGMTRETVSHIFEPFFTTKESGKGTGLGLAVVHEIIKDHLGHIQVASQPGRGTQIHISFQTWAASRNQPEVTPIDTRRSAGHRELIVLAGDDSYFLQIMASALESNDYQITTADNRKNALETIARYGDQTKLVIVDLGLDNHSDLSCIEEIRSKHTTLPIIVVSENISPSPKESSETKEYVLAKPFKMSEMVNMVGRVLNS